MKKIILTSILLTSSCLFLQAQWSLYVLGGFSPAHHPNSADLIVNGHSPLETFLFNMPSSKAQYFAGFILRRGLRGDFFTTLGIAYTHRQDLYKMSYIVPRSIGTTQELSVTEHRIGFPVGIGVNLHPVEVVCGIQGTWVIARSCELSKIEGFEDHHPFFQMGWHSALQVNMDRIIAGIEYQADLSRLCTGMCVKGESIELRQVPGKIVLKIQYQLYGFLK